ncbi:MAG: hypothetical protein ACLFOY_13200 [Desulfatibacillaceae bacterium]
MQQCQSCGTRVPADELLEHEGRRLCEDCRMNAMARPRVCDPWAVYHATRTRESGGGQLTSAQQRIVDLVRGNPGISLAGLFARAGMDADTFERDFAALRHMEILGGQKSGDDVIIRLLDE